MRTRVLFLSELHPYILPMIGAQLRVSRIVEALLVNHAVTFAAAIEEENQSLLKQWPSYSQLESIVLVNRLPYELQSRWGGFWHALDGIRPRRLPKDLEERMPRELLPKLQKLRESGEIDVVWASRTWMGELAREAGFDRIIVDVDDFEGPILEQEIERLRPYRREHLHRRMAKKLARYESSLTSRFDAVVVVKDQDREHLVAGDSRQVFRFGNGVDLPERYSSTAAPNAQLLFVGALRYEPNMNAIRWFIDNCFAHVRREYASAELVIAGRGPVPDVLQKAAQVPGVRLIESPAELDSLYAAARVVIAPIHSGNGTRLKVLEALAHARPLVATTEAVRGFPLTDGVVYKNANDAKTFADACVQLMRDDGLCERIGSQGRAWAEVNASWKTTMRDIESVVEFARNAPRSR